MWALSPLSIRILTLLTLLNIAVYYHDKLTELSCNLNKLYMQGYVTFQEDPRRVFQEAAMVVAGVAAWGVALALRLMQSYYY